MPLLTLALKRTHSSTITPPLCIIHLPCSQEAANCVVHERTSKGLVGLVDVSAAGEVAMPYNTLGMFRACATEDGYSEIAIWPSS
ncbi:hypothetical protein JHK85_016269 [Glycine max]|nr:hypothetical protein JHK85_016269 [Glycine max]